MHTLALIVPEALSGERLDQAIARLAPELSRRMAKRLIDDGAVFIDGKRAQVCSRAVRAGNRVRVTVGSAADPGMPPPRVIHLDADLVVVDKPAGAPTEPTRQGSRGTVHAALLEHLHKEGMDTAFLHAAHRLDADTTGVLVFARNPAAAHGVGEQLASGSVERRYLGLVTPPPPWSSARLDAPLLSTGREGRGRVFVDPQGLPSLTVATVLERTAVGALVFLVVRSTLRAPGSLRRAST